MMINKEDVDGIVDDCMKKKNWVRHHRKMRRTCFTAMKVGKGPMQADEVGDFRVTLA